MKRSLEAICLFLSSSPFLSLPRGQNERSTDGRFSRVRQMRTRKAAILTQVKKRGRFCFGSIIAPGMRNETPEKFSWKEKLLNLEMKCYSLALPISPKL